MKGRIIGYGVAATIVNILNDSAQKGIYTESFDREEPQGIFALASQNTVTLSDDETGIRYYIDFERRQVVTSKLTEMGFGAVDYAPTGSVSFDEFDATTIELALKGGCEIVGDIRNHTPNILHGTSYKALFGDGYFHKHQVRAEAFDESYCPAEGVN